MPVTDTTSRLLWVDLEMTGLDPRNQRIIEVAAIVTGFDLEELGSYEAVIHQDDTILGGAERWPRKHMKKLLAESRASQITEEQAVTELLELIDAHFGPAPAVLAGNSIHQDRRFIRQWWPQVEERLHYRMLDVSSFKIWVKGTRGVKYHKSDAHRAMDDIRESIRELGFCLSHLGPLDAPGD